MFLSRTALLSSKGDKSGESEVNEVKVPPDIVCGLCSGVMKDAVIITCCQESFCDECEWSVLQV